MTKKSSMKQLFKEWKKLLVFWNKKYNNTEDLILE